MAKSILGVQHVTGTGSGLLGGIPRVVVQISALTLKGPLYVFAHPMLPGANSGMKRIKCG